MSLNWYTSGSADGDHNDQEVDLDHIGNPRGASWAYVASNSNGKTWSWAIVSRWLWEDDDGNPAEVLAEGEADGEAEAKAAVEAWVSDEHTSWITAGGYKVQTVSTTDKGQWFRVTGPHGFEVMLNPHEARHSPPIRTTGQLMEVLAREGEDFSTLKEI